LFQLFPDDKLAVITDSAHSQPLSLQILDAANFFARNQGVLPEVHRLGKINDLLPLCPIHKGTDVVAEDDVKLAAEESALRRVCVGGCGGTKH
jgi:hypothetical protein